MTTAAAAGGRLTLSAAAALPLDDGLVVVAPSGAVCALDAAGRRLWEAVEAGCDAGDLIGACVHEGGLGVDEASARVMGALEAWRELGFLDAPRRPDPGAPAPPEVVTRPPGRRPALDRVYAVGDRPVRICCDDAALGELIEFACAPFRVDGAADAAARVDVVERDGRFLVRADDAVVANTWSTTPNRRRARHWCLTAAAEVARHRPLLGILHASAVSERGRCVVLAAARHSGKTTLAAGLTATGAAFVADDYVLLERGSRLAWPVPFAQGVKRGSWPVLGRYYPRLRDLPVCTRCDIEIKWLEQDESRRAPLGEGVPVRALVFPRYEEGAAPALRRTTATEALVGLCRAGSMLDRDPAVLAETLRWLEATPAYELAFGSLEAAIDLVRGRLLRGV